MTSDPEYKHEPLIKSPWRQICGCWFFMMLYSVVMIYSIWSGQSFQLSFSFHSLAIIMYLIFFALLFFLPQNAIDWITSKYYSVEISNTKREIPIERAESDIPTDRAE